MTGENIEYIDAYIFMTYENMLKTLEKKRLKVLFPEECNDPFEFMPALPTKLEDGCISSNSDYLRKEYGFLSFTKTYKSPPMWAHYADNHKGCCVHFRFPALPEQNSCEGKFDYPEYPSYIYRKLLIKYEGESFYSITPEITNHTILWDVLYQKKRSRLNEISSRYIKFENKEYFETDRIFIIKDKSWEYEQEQRVLIPTSPLKEVEGNLKFVRGFNPYIKSIMLGMRCPYPEGLTQSRVNVLTLREKNGTKITYSSKKCNCISVSKVQPTRDTFEVISDEHENLLQSLKENGE